MAGKTSAVSEHDRVVVQPETDILGPDERCARAMEKVVTMATRFRFEFPPEVQRERQALIEEIRDLTAENTLDSIRVAHRRQAE